MGYRQRKATHTGRRSKREKSERFSKKDTVRGYFSLSTRGFGFVNPELGGEDIFIPPGAVGPAMQGDGVVVRFWPSAKGFEGEIIDIWYRAVTHVVGTLRQAASALWLESDDPRMRGPMQVQGSMPSKVSPGIEVIAKIIDYPSRAGEAPVVEITEALGPAGVAKVEVEKIKIREAVRETFSAKVQKEADSFASHLGKKDLQGREDLRDVELVTIDPEDARDHDDALWVSKNQDGSFLVLIAIADVSHYVTPESALDEEAQMRGCSIYLPDRAIPMLPERLSAGLCSLVPNEDRFTLALEIEIRRDGSVKAFRYIEGVMRSAAKLSYEGVAHELGLSTQAKAQSEAKRFHGTLATMWELSQILRQRRMKRGALNLELPETKIVLDPVTEEPLRSVQSRKDPGISKAYTIVEELMLLANETVAADLDKQTLPCIFRVHDKPDPKKMQTFAKMAEAFGFAMPADAAENPKQLGKFLKQIHSSPNASLLHSLLLRAMQQAVYDTKNIGHFGLAAKSYLHFTSPIRRYPDLLVHREVRALIRHRKLNHDKVEHALRLHAVRASRLERRAMTVEREVSNLYSAILMRPFVGHEFTATISSISNFGFYCAIEDPYVEALCRVAELDGDFYELDDMGLRWIGKRSGQSFGLGDKLRIFIEDVSIHQREVRAIPIENFHKTKYKSSKKNQNKKQPGKPRPSRKTNFRKKRKR
ncbi:MAG: ribonuclease R [Myxococcales bacterium]|nr:MAG: ribonuclease R [Myxococcales bacterium]